MRHATGDDRLPAHLFTSRVRPKPGCGAEYPLRAIRALVVGLLRTDVPDSSTHLCGGWARPSIPPERLLRAQLVQFFYSVRT
jgi:hypothetical protein